MTMARLTSEHGKNLRFDLTISVLLYIPAHFTCEVSLFHINAVFTIFFIFFLLLFFFYTVLKKGLDIMRSYC